MPITQLEKSAISVEELQLLSMLVHYCEIVGKQAGMPPGELWCLYRDQPQLNMWISAAATVTFPMVSSVGEEWMKSNDWDARIETIRLREQRNLEDMIGNLSICK